jgi:hypothetical protein
VTQLCKVAISVDVGADAGDGGMGEFLFWMRCKATCASVKALFERSCLVKSA